MFKALNLKIVFLVLPALILFGIGIVKILGKPKQAVARPVTGQHQEAIQPQKVPIEIRRRFEFEIANKPGPQPSVSVNSKERETFFLFLDSAELKDEIILKGQKAQAVSPNIFLIINVKLTNNHNYPININSRDYVRLVMDNNEEEQLAPDIYNDPIEIQALSTKTTRLGVSIKNSDKNLKLKVGEIDGNKADIPLSFK